MTSTIYVIAWSEWNNPLQLTVRTGANPVDAILQISELRDFWEGVDLEAAEASGDPHTLIEALSDQEVDLVIAPYENLVDKILPAE